MSFRTRIFGISVLIVAAVLIAVMSLSWTRIMNVQLGYLDARLCMEARRIVPRKNAVKTAPKLTNQTPGRQFTEDLAEKLRVESAKQLLVVIESPQYESDFLSNKKVDTQFVDNLNWSLPHQSSTLIQSDNSARNKSSELCQLASFENEQGNWRASLYTQPHARSFVAVDLNAANSDLLNAIRISLVAIIPLAILFSAIGAWIIASITMRPVNQLHKSMGMVTQKSLNHRLPEHNEDKEFKILIDAYNTMLDRLEESFQQTSRFTSDAAHELKTPLTILRGRLEQAINSEEPHKVDLSSILDEVGHLSAITRKLLLLSQADSGSMALHLTPINITLLLDELIDDLELLSEDNMLSCDIKRNLILNGDAILLRQLFNNLFSNAMRYCQPDDGIRIGAHLYEQQIEFTISNHCRPISDADRLRIFDRFYRGDPTHHQGISGSGLGLSLAREIARAHEGELILTDTPKDVASFRLRLPIR